MSKRLVLVASILVLALALGPSVAFAETFTLPGGEQLVYYGNVYTSGGPMPQLHEVYAGYDYYGWTPHIYYRVLIDGSGKETVLDSYKTSGTRTIYSWRNDLEGHRYVYFDLPALNVTLDKPGTYTVDFRQIVINRPTAERFPNAGLGSTVDLWDVNYYAFNDRPVECTRQYYTDCYVEYLKQADVPIESLAETLGIAVIDVAGNDAIIELPAISGKPGEGQPISPFDQNTGDAQKQDDGIPLAVAGLGGVALVSAVALAGGSRIMTFLTAAGQRAEDAKTAALAQMQADKEAYANWYADLQAKKTKDKQLAALSAAQAEQQARMDSLNADYAKIQNSKMGAAETGSALAALTTKYSDVLSDDGKKQLMQASNDAWSANKTVTATAVFSPQVMAQMIEPAPAKQNDILGDLWNGFTGAMSGLGKTTVIGLTDQAKYYAQLGTALSKGDVVGAAGIWVDKTRKDADILIDTVKNHGWEIAAGIAIGAVAVVTAPIWVPVVGGAAAAIGISTATFLATTAIVATGAYVVGTYGPTLNKVNDSCTWGECMDGGQSIKDLQEKTITDFAIVGGTWGLGGVASRPIGAAIVRKIPVEGLIDDAARKTYKIALNMLENTKAYGGIKKIVVVGKDVLGYGRAAVENNILYINKDALNLWRQFPTTAIPHEIGHQVVTDGFGVAAKDTIEKTLLGTKAGGMGIEVAAEKNAFLLNGKTYATAWQKWRSFTHLQPLLDDASLISQLPEEYAYMYTVYKNIGNPRAAQAILSAAKQSSNFIPEYFNILSGQYQRVWDTTGLNGMFKGVSALIGLGGSNVAK